MLMVLSMSLKMYCQQVVLIKNDTNICFAVPQAKFLLKQVYKAKEYVTLDSICEKQLSAKDTVIKSNKVQIANLTQVHKNDSEKVWLKEYQVSKLEGEKIILNKEIKKQKALKNGGFTAAGILFLKILFNIFK